MRLAAVAEKETVTTGPAGRGRTVHLVVHRQNPATKEPAKDVTYVVPFFAGMTVLDAVIWAKENADASLSYRCSCRMGICGSCGMMINGVPRLACETQVSTLGDLVEVGPLPNYPLVRDVATDFTAFFEKFRDVRPYLVRQDREGDGPIVRELLQTEAQKTAYVQFANCIMCGLCNAACPISTMDDHFLGPQALARAFRFTADSRDQGWRERLPVLDSPRGCWECELSASCSAACPKGVDPALAIQLLKRTILRRRLGLR